MSRHDGVSCDSCLKGNFRGRRYKCLVCYDYDLCANCYDVGTTTTRHTSDHAMQCILTRNDFEMYYGGEALTIDQPQSFTCPYCGKKGFLEATLQDHITGEHSDSASEVVCPICAALPGGDPNHVTDDFASHLTLEHRAPREFKLLSQLSSVRSRAVAAQSVSSQLQQLEMQLQSTRQQLERLPRRQADTYASVTSKPTPPSTVTTTTPPTTGVTDDKSQVVSAVGGAASPAAAATSTFLLSRCTDSPPPEEATLKPDAMTATDHGLFIQELLATTLAQLPTPKRETETTACQNETAVVETKAAECDNGCDNDIETINLEIETTITGMLDADPPPANLKPPLNVNSSAVVAEAFADAETDPVTADEYKTMRQVTVVTEPVHTFNPCRAQRNQYNPAWLGATSTPHPRQPRLTGSAAKRSMLKHVEGAKKGNDPPH